MDRQEALDLCSYDEWANERILAALRRLPADELVRNLGSSYPTLRSTFAHLVAGEWVWHERWGGRSPDVAPAWIASGELEELATILADVTARRRGLLEGLGAEGLARPVAFRYLDGRPGEFLLADLVRHVVNHSTYHRGQLVTMVRQVGGEVAQTDFIAWRDPARR